MSLCGRRLLVQENFYAPSCGVCRFVKIKTYRINGGLEPNMTQLFQFGVYSHRSYMI